MKIEKIKVGISTYKSDPVLVAMKKAGAHAPYASIYVKVIVDGKMYGGVVNTGEEEPTLETVEEAINLMFEEAVKFINKGDNNGA